METIKLISGANNIGDTQQMEQFLSKVEKWRKEIELKE